MLSHPGCFLDLLSLWYHVLLGNFSEAESATGINRVKSCSGQKGCFACAGCLEQSRLDATSSPRVRGVAAGGQVGATQTGQRNNQVFKSSLCLHHACALIVSPGTCRSKNSKLLSLKLALLRDKQFSRAVFFPYPELWLKFIGFDPLYSKTFSSKRLF